MGLILFAVFLLTIPGAQAALTQIGAAGAVAGRVTALAPQAGAAGRVLSSGKTVYFNDRIATGAAGRLQVLLLDETVFTIGPNAEMIIDEFVYDPFTQSGKVAAQVTKGVFRFVSGKVARKKPSAMKVKLPTGTIGIRGTIAGGSILPDGSTLIALLGPGADNNAGERPGAIEVQNAGETVILTQPGFATIIRPGQPPLPPFRLSPEQLADLSTKPQAEAGAGDPAGSEGDAKETGALGEANTTAEATGSEQAESEEKTQNTANAAQDAAIVADGLGRWDQVRTIESGQSHFNATFVDAFSHTTCSSTCDGLGDFSIQMNIDFAARSYGGAGESVSINSDGLSASASIPQTSFADLQGDAVINLNALNADFLSGSKIELLNKGGNPAEEARVTVIYDNGSDAGSGTGTAPRQDGFLGL